LGEVEDESVLADKDEAVLQYFGQSASATERKGKLAFSLAEESDDDTVEDADDLSGMMNSFSMAIGCCCCCLCVIVGMCLYKRYKKKMAEKKKLAKLWDHPKGEKEAKATDSSESTVTAAGEKVTAAGEEKAKEEEARARRKAKLAADRELVKTIELEPEVKERVDQKIPVEDKLEADPLPAAPAKTEAPAKKEESAVEKLAEPEGPEEEAPKKFGTRGKKAAEELEAPETVDASTETAAAAVPSIDTTPEKRHITVKDEADGSFTISMSFK